MRRNLTEAPVPLEVGQEPITTIISIDTIRHGKKMDKKDTPQELLPEGFDSLPPNEQDKYVRLTQEGVTQAKDKGRTLGIDIQRSVGKASPRLRTHETLLHVLHPDSLPADFTLEQMDQVTEDFLSLDGIQRRKYSADKRLDFNLSGPAGQKTLAHMKTGDYVKYMVENSDRDAVEMKDTVSTTYTRFAGNGAELLLLYARAGDQFNKLASKNLELRKKTSDKLERYFTTHQLVAEALMSKVLEKVGGVARRDAFIATIGNSFNESEGIHVDIINRAQEQTIVLSFTRNGYSERVEITKELLKEIVEERKEFDRRLSFEHQ